MTRLVVSAAARLHTRVVEISRDLRVVLAGEIHELDGDPRLVELLGASIEGNVETILHMLAHEIAPTELQAPSAAVEYTRRLAQRGVPVNALLRAYRLGQDNLLRVLFEEIERQADDPVTRVRATQRIVAITFGYIDWVSQRLTGVYDQERERWLHQHNTVRLARVRELLDADLDGATAKGFDVGAAEAALGYRLRRRHLGVVVWAPEQDRPPALDDAVAALARALPDVGRPLFCAHDRSSGWAWLPLGPATGEGSGTVAEPATGEGPGAGSGTAAADTDALVARVAAAVSAAAPQCRVALGSAQSGPAGFQDTHRQALAAQRVAVTAGATAPPVIGFAQAGVRAAALLAADLDGTRRLVSAVLGRLATGDEGHERLRETLRTFLSTADNYTATAELLRMHKNTVKYRIARAEAERGAPVGADRLDVALALLACRWLGPAVLLPS